MSSSTQPMSRVVVRSSDRRPAPKGQTGPFAWLKNNLFNSVHNTILTIFLFWLAFLILPPIAEWSVINAVWTPDNWAECRSTSGACWAVVAEKYRVMLFGTFPYEQDWRGVLVIIIFIAMAIVSTFKRLWSFRLFLSWIVVMVIILALQLGGIFGLKSTPTYEWGGLPLTLILFVGTVVGGLPLAVLLALGRRSSLPIIRAFSIGMIEIMRGIPLLVVLFMMSLMLPLFLPAGLTVDKVLRAQLGMILFFGAYAAESVRGGLQAIPKGQYEAGDAIGLTYWQKTRKIVLPQALRIVIPALMNDIVRAFKNTTFVSIIGLFDVLGATSSAVADPKWELFAPEAYLFVFALYFVFCFVMSQFSEHLEKDLTRGRNL